MGTDKPNANAVLELYAKDHSQGFLVPRLTTAQRTAAAFTSRLGQADHGLLVFDTDQGAFYFWFEGKWEQSIGEDSNILKKANWYTGNTAPNMPAENGDFYINNTTGDLYRHQNGTFEIIGTIKEKSYQAGAGINVSTDGTITNTGDLNSTNEIQDLQLNNNTIKITNNPAASAIDLTPYLDNTDQQTLSFDPATQKLSLSNGGSVNLNSINTDSQDLNLNGNTLSLTNDITSVNLSATSPTDGQVLKWNAAQNHWEAQSDAIGTTYTAGTGISINGSNQIINTAPNQAVSLTGTGAATVSGTYPNFTINATDNVDDADNDPANEIQDLQLTGNTLKVTNNLGATDINLAGYLDNTDGQTLSFNTTTQELSLSNGGMVNLGSINTDAQNLSLSGNTLSLTNDATNVSLSATTPANGEVLKWNAAQNRWEAQSDNDTQNLSDILSKGNNASGSKITNLATPTAASDAATKSYVDALKALPEGNMLVGNSAGVAIPLSAKTAGNILVGNGTTVASIAITGELVLQADGTLTINNLAVTTQKIADGAISTPKIANNAVVKEKKRSMRMWQATD